MLQIKWDNVANLSVITQRIAQNNYLNDIDNHQISIHDKFSTETTI